MEIEIIIIFLLILYIIYLRQESKELRITNIELLNENKDIVENINKRIENINLLNKRIQNKYRRINYLRRIIWELKRKLKDTKISRKELIAFANDHRNNIKVKMCHENAKIFYKKFGGKIVLGAACYLDLDQNTKEVTSHLWNEYTYNDNGKSSIQMIDILNFKVDEREKYFKHRGIELEKDKYQEIEHWYKVKEQVEKIISQKKEDTLLSYNNDTINDVYKLH
jgi:hypothetical protein